jgi:hypothetical protein
VEPHAAPAGPPAHHGARRDQDISLPRREGVSIASIIALGILGVIVICFALLVGVGAVPLEILLSPAFLIVPFFTALFAFEFLPFNKLKYGLYAALPFGAVIALAFCGDLIRFLPLLLLAFGLIALGLISWSARKEREAMARIPWRDRLEHAPKPGEKTRRILGHSNEVREKDLPPGSLLRSRQMRHKGIYFRNP